MMPLLIRVGQARRRTGCNISWILELSSLRLDASSRYFIKSVVILSSSEDRMQLAWLLRIST